MAEQHMGDPTLPHIQPDPLMETPSSRTFELSRRNAISDNPELVTHIAALSAKAKEAEIDIPDSYTNSNDFWAIVAGSLPEITKTIEKHIPDEETREKIALNLAVISAKEVKTAEDEATIDPLTGARSRRVLEEEVSHLIEHQREGSITGVLFIDVDHFKDFNTIYGHPGGDAALVALVQELQKHVRPSDIVGRYGGEEFVILLRDIPDGMIASAKAEQIRQAIRENTSLVHIGDQAIGLSISVGVTTIKPTDTTTKDVWERGSAHVTTAKNEEGRNTVLDDFGAIQSVEYTQNAKTNKSRVTKVTYKN